MDKNIEQFRQYLSKTNPQLSESGEEVIDLYEELIVALDKVNILVDHLSIAADTEEGQDLRTCLATLLGVTRSAHNSLNTVQLLMEACFKAPGEDNG